MSIEPLSAPSASSSPDGFASSAPLVEIDGLHKVYRNTPAVKELSFVVRPGQILGLVGPNGAGKTTTMRTLAGIIPPTRGRLAVAGHDVVVDPVAAKKLLAYVPDDPKLFDALTVEEHLEFVAAAYDVPDYKTRMQPLLEEFELWDKRQSTAGELSRGMRQKVAICCAYLHDPKVVMFDEPHTGLDPRGIRTMKHSVLTRARRGTAVIVSSHLLNLVEDLCTHLLILNKGESLFFGTLDECRSAFAHLVGGDASLEEVFLHATEGSLPPREDGSAAAR